MTIIPQPPPDDNASAGQDFQHNGATDDLARVVTTPNTQTTSNACPAASGTCPAQSGTPSNSENALSGTSGTLFSPTNLSARHTPSITTPFHHITNLYEENLPDVPDPQNMPAGQLPDSAGQCRTGAGLSDAGGLGPGPNGQPSPVDATLPAETERTRPPVVVGCLRIGQMFANRGGFQRLQSPDLYELLDRAAPPDTIIEAEPGAQITIADVDTHDWPQPPTPAELSMHLAGVHPRPDAVWTSHGRGIKLVYCGRNHADRALAAAFSFPSAFNIELLRHTRHPRSASTQHGDATCGQVEYFANDLEEEFVFHAVGPPTREQREEALERLGLVDGARYDHDRCPIDPGAESDATNCVTVLAGGVYCHRCAAHGVRYNSHLAPGFFPFSATIENGTSLLDRHAESMVHWTHASIVLRHHFPNLAEPVLKLAYRRTLGSRHGVDDLRIRSVFNQDLDFVRGDGLWLDSTSFGPTTVDNDAAGGLPYVQKVIQGKDGKKEIMLDLVRRSQVKNRAPHGYLPIRPVRGISFGSDDDTIPIIAPPIPQHPIRLLTNPLPIDEAFRQLQACFPRLSRRYFFACLAAAICGDARRGQPTMLACTGPSGSAKEQTIRLAASFLGEDIVKLPLTEDDEKFMRNVGIALSSGRRFLVFDELGKVRKISGMSRMLLQISGTACWRPLYQNHFVHTQVRGAFFFPCVRFPEAITNSQEFCRRIRREHLHHQVPNWADTSGGDTCDWRDRSPENAHIANSILTHIWRLCNEYEFRFQ